MLFSLPPVMATAHSSVASMSAASAASVTALADTAIRYGSDHQVVLTRAFSGGHNVIFIAKAKRGIGEFLDVNASELLATYEFDQAGNLLDKKIWKDCSTKVDPREKIRLSQVFSKAFKQEKEFPWLRNNLQVSVFKVEGHYEIYCEPLAIEKAKKDML